MNKVFFYTAYIFAVLVFFAFFVFMLWHGVEMANQMDSSAVSPTFWTIITDIGLFVLSGVGFFLFIATAYIAFAKGHKAPMSTVAPARLIDEEPSLPIS